MDLARQGSRERALPGYRKLLETVFICIRELRMRRITAAVGVAERGLAVGVSRLRPGPAHARAARHGTATVVASTDVWGSVASAVAGDHAAVKSIVIQRGRRPALVRGHPGRRRRDRRRLAGGLQRRRLRPLGRRRAGRAIPVSSAINAYSLLPDTGQPANEHVFFDPDTVKAVADQVADRLAQADSRHADDYRGQRREFGKPGRRRSPPSARSARPASLGRRSSRPNRSPTTCCAPPGSPTARRKASQSPSRRATTRPRPTSPPCST